MMKRNLADAILAAAHDGTVREICVIAGGNKTVYFGTMDTWRHGGSANWLSYKRELERLPVLHKSVRGGRMTVFVGE